MRILVVDDEEKVTSYLKKGLIEEGYKVDICGNGYDGFKMAMSNSYDLILLDIMMPGYDGVEVLRKLRANNNETPVIFLTARDAVEDRIQGLQVGADDYLVKPFAYNELIARIQVILRRGAVKTPDVIRIGDLEIDQVAHRASRGGKRIDLTPKEFSILKLLARKQGEVLSRTKIAEHVWNLEYDHDTNVVDVHIRRLRAKVDDPFEEKLIHTIRGFGYVLEQRNNP